MKEEPWVMLKDSTMTPDKVWDSYEKGYPGKWYHVEPLMRYLTDPPQNPVWYLVGVYPNYVAAFEAANSDLETLLRKTSVMANNYGPRMRFQILRRDSYCCQLCGRSAADGVKLEIDHKLAKTNGGTDDPDNLWTLCYECNRGKGTQSL